MKEKVARGNKRRVGLRHGEKDERYFIRYSDRRGWWREGGTREKGGRLEI
jgi:hypothetical protein